MNCPFCNAEMETGYIQGRDGIYWGKKRNAIAALSFLNSTLVLASGGGPFSGSAIESYHCPTCKKIVIDNCLNTCDDEK